MPKQVPTLLELHGTHKSLYPKCSEALVTNLTVISWRTGLVQIWTHSRISKFSLVAQSCPTLCNPMNCCIPGLPVHHQLPESTQTHVHWVGDAIQPSHPLLSPSPPALNLSQHQGLFKRVSSSHEVAKVLEFQLQHQSFPWTPRTLKGWTGWISSWYQGALKSLLQHHSSKALILQCSAFFILQFSYTYMTTGKTIALTR